MGNLHSGLPMVKHTSALPPLTPPFASAMPYGKFTSAYLQYLLINDPYLVLIFSFLHLRWIHRTTSIHEFASFQVTFFILSVILFTIWSYLLFCSLDLTMSPDFICLLTLKDLTSHLTGRIGGGE